MNANFSITSESLDGLEIVNVSGELDQATAPELRRALDPAIAKVEVAVLVDLGRCEFIDSTGLSLLVEAQRRLSETARSFAVCNPRSEVTRLLELTGIDAAVGIYGTRKEAIASLAVSATTE